MQVSYRIWRTFLVSFRSFYSFFFTSGLYSLLVLQSSMQVFFCAAFLHPAFLGCCLDACGDSSGVHNRYSSAPSFLLFSFIFFPLCVIPFSFTYSAPFLFCFRHPPHTYTPRPVWPLMVHLPTFVSLRPVYVFFPDAPSSWPVIITACPENSLTSIIDVFKYQARYKCGFSKEPLLVLFALCVSTELKCCVSWLIDWSFNELFNVFAFKLY